MSAISRPQFSIPIGAVQGAGTPVTLNIEWGRFFFDLADSVQLTGDVISSGTSRLLTTSLANSGVTPGSYTFASFTVDAKGRLTSASSGTAGGTVTNVAVSAGIETLSGSAITSTGTLRAGKTINAQTGTTYSYADSDRAKLVTHTNAANMAGTLPQAGASSQFVANWFMDVKNMGVGTLTITPTTSTIDAAASLVLSSGQGCTIVSNGTNYVTQRGGSGGTPGGSNTQIQYNNAGAFGGDAAFTFGNATGVVTATADMIVNSLTVGRGGGAGNSCVTVGYLAMPSTTGTGNVALGNQVMSVFLSGSSNVGIGDHALYVTTASDNIGIGNSALYSNDVGSQNVAVGSGALLSNTASSNTAIGYAAGYAGGTNQNTTGINNTFIGRNAIGASSTDDNKITLGDTNITHIRAQVTAITAISDARDKSNIADLPWGLDFISSLRPVQFTWAMRGGGKVGIKDSGFIAQELQEAQTFHGAAEHLHLVFESNPDRLEATYGNLIPVLVKAIQELTAEFDMYVRAHP